MRVGGVGALPALEPPPQACSAEAEDCLLGCSLWGGGGRPESTHCSDCDLLRCSFHTRALAWPRRWDPGERTPGSLGPHSGPAVTCIPRLWPILPSQATARKS